MGEENKLEKVKLLVTITQRGKSNFYVDLLEQFDVNLQMVLRGRGTAPKELSPLWGMDLKDRDIILSFVTEDKSQKILKKLSEKFSQIKQGNGIAFTLPIKSMIGVSLYQFMINNRNRRES